MSRRKNTREAPGPQGQEAQAVSWAAGIRVTTPPLRRLKLWRISVAKREIGRNGAGPSAVRIVETADARLGVEPPAAPGRAEIEIVRGLSSFGVAEETSGRSSAQVL